MYSELFVVLLVVCIIAFNKMKNNRNSSVQTDNENKPQYKFKTIDLIPILLRECDNGNSQAIVDRAYIAYYKPELFSNPPSKQDIYNTFKDAFYKRNDLYSGWNTAIMNYYGEGTDQNIDEFYKIIKILIDLGFCDKDSNDRNIVAGYPQIKNLLNELFRRGRRKMQAAEVK